MKLTVEELAGNDKSMEETKELRNEKRTTEEIVECNSKPNRKFVARPMRRKGSQIKRQIYDQILRSSTGARSEPKSEPGKWCIYRVPKKLRKANNAAYTPQLLSIGPFHHGKPGLKDMETYKKMYYENFCERCTKKHQNELKGFIRERKQDILHCYAGTTKLHVDVILVDACFIIQLFLLNFEDNNNDYILRSEWLRKAVEHELILFENQLPYFLLEDLYEFAMPAVSSPESQEQKVEGNESSRDNQQYSSCSTGPRDHPTSVDQSGKTAKPRTFLELTWKFFKDYSKGKSEVKPKHFTDLVRYFLCPPPKPTEPTEPTPPKHFTDLVRYFLCPPPKPTKTTEPKKEIKISVDNDVPVKSKYDIRKLTAAGVKFRPLDEGTVHYVIEKYSGEAHKCKFNLPCFRNMKLKLTQFCVKYETECLIRNVMALEQILYPHEPYICSYFLLMDQLVDTVEDVDLLVEEQIIVNLLGSNKAVMKLVNSLCEQIKEDKSCYSGLCVELNKHYEISKVNRSVAILKRVYFKDLWTSSSTVLGVVVLLFSVVGTIKSLMS